MKNWYVYICQANTGRYYVGMSTDPKVRLKRHNNKDGAKLARDQGPFRLVYVSLPFSNKFDARTREIQVKDWSQFKKKKLISGEWV